MKISELWMWPRLKRVWSETFLIAAGYFPALSSSLPLSPLSLFFFLHTSRQKNPFILAFFFSLSARPSSESSRAHHLFYNEAHHGYVLCDPFELGWIFPLWGTTPKPALFPSADGALTLSFLFFFLLAQCVCIRGKLNYKKEKKKRKATHQSCCSTASTSTFICHLHRHCVLTYAP